MNAESQPVETGSFTLLAATSSAMAFFIAVLCGCGPPDVDIQKLPTPPQVGATAFENTLPGFPGTTYVHPTQLEVAVCAEPQASIIMWGGVSVSGMAPPPPKIGRVNGPANNQFVAFWTVCNQGQAAQEAGQSYQLTTSLRTTTKDLPPTDPNKTVDTPFTDGRSPVLPIPALPKCTCFVQLVGVNMDVPLASTQQSTLTGLSAAFPRIDLTPTAPSATQTFQYVESLPANFGAQQLVFEIL